MTRPIMLAAILAVVAAPPANAQLEHMRQTIFGMD